MTRKRWMVGLAGCVLAAFAAVAMWRAMRLPAPEEADQRGLVRWLVTRDLEEEEVETQNRLLARVEAELRTGVDLASAQSELTPEQFQQLLRNADILARRWFAGQVDRYFGQPEELRAEFLEGQIDELQGSGIGQSLASLTAEAGGKPEGVSGTGGWTKLSGRVERWISSFDEKNQSKARRWVAAAQSALFLRTVRGLFRSPQFD